MNGYGYPCFNQPKFPIPPPKFILAVLAMLLLTILVFWNIAKANPPAAELIASWYSIASLKQEGTYKYSKGVMANGEKFKEEAFTCATRLYPLGTTLLVKSLYSGKSVRVRVTDRIGKLFAKIRIDLSKRAFTQIADLKQGLCKVRVEVVK